MVTSKTLGKIALGLMFPCVGMGFYVQYTVKKGFAERPWYNEAIELLKGYKPAMDRLGEPISFKRIDVSDEFNYKDMTLARAKIPVSGQKCKAQLFVYAKPKGRDFEIDYLELQYDSYKKFKFYDGNLASSPKPSE